MEISEKQLNRIDSNLEKLASLKYNFILSVIKGVGSVIGATIVTALVVWMLSGIVSVLGGIPFLEGILEQIK